MPISRESFYFQGVGKAYLLPEGGYDPEAETPVGGRLLGNVPSLSISLAEEVFEHFESQTSSRGKDLVLRTQKAVSGTVNFEDMSAENIEIITRARKQAIEGGAVAEESLGDVPLNSPIPLAGQGITNFSIIDSDSVLPKTLPAAQYQLNAAHGSVVVTDKTTGGPYTAPFKAAYTKAARTGLPLHHRSQAERFFLRFEGLNLAKQDNDGSPVPVLVELYIVEFGLGPDLAMIQESGIANIAAPFEALLDTGKLASGPLGQFGRMVVTPDQVQVP